MSMGICHLAAEYYVAHREWPLSKAQLEEQLKRSLEKERAQMPAEVTEDISEFLDRFTFLDFRTRGENLVLHYRFKIDGKTVDQIVTIPTKPTTDEILEAATPRGY